MSTINPEERLLLIGFWIDHMNRYPRGIGIDLIENVGKLHVKLILGHTANMRRSQNIWVSQEKCRYFRRVASIIERIDLGCASNLMRVLICLTAPDQALTTVARFHKCSNNRRNKYDFSNFTVTVLGNV